MVIMRSMVQSFWDKLILILVVLNVDESRCEILSEVWRVTKSDGRLSEVMEEFISEFHFFERNISKFAGRGLIGVHQSLYKDDPSESVNDR